MGISGINPAPGVRRGRESYSGPPEPSRIEPTRRGTGIDSARSRCASIEFGLPQEAVQSNARMILPYSVINLGACKEMDITKDIQPMTTFRNHSAAFLAHLRETKRPMVLTVNGKAAAVVQDAEAY